MAYAHSAKGPKMNKAERSGLSMAPQNRTDQDEVDEDMDEDMDDANDADYDDAKGLVEV